jgi:putative ABC transport system permease protein
MRAFDLRLAWQTLRGELKRVWLVVFCVGIGVSAQVSIDSFLRRVDQALSHEARTLLTADLEISKSAPFTEEESLRIRSALPDSARLQQVSSFVTMGSVPGKWATRLLEIRAVDSEYPFYGRLRLSDEPSPREQSSDLSKLFTAPPAIYVETSLLDQLSVKVGDAIRLGEAEFRIAGTILEEPGLGAGFFSLGPKVLIGRSQLARTGLAEKGSRIHYSWLVSLPDDASPEDWAQKLRREWGLPEAGTSEGSFSPQDSRIRVQTFKDKQSQLRRFFDRLGDYLRLVSLMALILGGIGIGSVVRGFVAEHAEAIALMKVLGFTSNRILRVYLLQILGLSLIGSAGGALAGTLLENIFPIVLKQFLPVSLLPGIHFPAIFWGVGLGLATSLYYGILPLLEIHSLKPLAVFRGEDLPSGYTALMGILLLLGAGLFGGVAAVESRSLVLGGFFGAAVFIGGGLIYLGGKLLLPQIQGIKTVFSGFAVRHGVSNLNRPSLRPSSAVVALGLASLLIGLLIVYQYSLLRELRPGSGSELPHFFLIDIQDDQAEDLRHGLEEKGVRKIVLSPMVKARYRGMNGRSVETQTAKTREGETELRMRTREQNLSYRAELSPDEELVAGQWLDPASKIPEASLEEWFAGQIGARIGDTLNFDVQGVPVEAKVTSIRKVRWASFRPNFFILLTPSVLEDAPKTWVAALAGIPPERRSEVQAEIVQRFPNITLFDVEQGSRRIIAIVDRICWAVRFLALFSLAAGLVVLSGIAFSTARARRTENALLKVLGANRRTVLTATAVEFGLLGSVASGIGISLSVGFGWVLTERILGVSFHMPWMQLSAAGLLIGGLCALTGVWASRGTAEARPLEALREG